MRKFFSRLVIIVATVLVISLTGYGVWEWNSLNDTLQPKPEVVVNGHVIEAKQTELKVRLLFGLLQRQFDWYGGNDTYVHLVLESFVVPVKLPQGYDSNISVLDADEHKIIFQGNLEAYKDFKFTQNREYTIKINLSRGITTDPSNEVVSYVVDVRFDVPPPPPPRPVVKASASSVVQGDAVAIEVLNVPEGETPIAKTELSLTTFAPLGEGRWIGYTGIADSREAGEYGITISFKDFEQIIPITVTSGQFGRQDLKIDTSAPAITEANSDVAYKQFRDKIRPFYETADPQIYWDGNFIQPVEGRISSEYGLLRYTNGGATPRRHSGIDVAAADGTPIKSPAGGRVVFSEYLLNTGNTLVIEHGGGLKSYYFHLSKRDVNVDTIVKAGQIVGDVGTTGYSTGPHLHFELRIGSQNLDPFKFFNGTSGCFKVER